MPSAGRRRKTDEQDGKVDFDSVYASEVIALAVSDIRQSIIAVISWTELVKDNPISKAMAFDGDSMTVGDVMDFMVRAEKKAFDVTLKLSQLSQELRQQIRSQNNVNASTDSPNPPQNDAD